MLILLPPSEGKCAPESGPRISLPSLSWPALQPARRAVFTALVELCSSSPVRAQTALGLTVNQANLVELNAVLKNAATAPAISVYAGVLYEALAFESLPTRAQVRGLERIAIASALWGLVRPGDLIPAYRFSADSRIPGFAPLPQIWAPVIGKVLAAEQGLIVDLRSSAYERLAPIPTVCANRAVQMRILQERSGKLSVVSHHNKATKGRIAAGLLRSAKEPKSVAALITQIQDLGFRAQEHHATGTAVPVLDVITKDL